METLELPYQVLNILKAQRVRINLLVLHSSAHFSHFLMFLRANIVHFTYKLYNQYPAVYKIVNIFYFSVQ